MFQSSIARGRNFYWEAYQLHRTLILEFQSSIARGRNFYPQQVCVWRDGAMFQSSIARGRNFYRSRPRQGRPPRPVSVLYRSRTQFLLVNDLEYVLRRALSFSPLSLEDAISTGIPWCGQPLSGLVSVLYRSRTQFLHQLCRYAYLPQHCFSPLSLEDAISTTGAFPEVAYEIVFQSSIARGRNFYNQPFAGGWWPGVVSVLYRSRTQFLPLFIFSPFAPRWFQSSIARGRNFYLELLWEG